MVFILGESNGIISLELCGSENNLCIKTTFSTQVLRRTAQLSRDYYMVIP